MHGGVFDLLLVAVPVLISLYMYTCDMMLILTAVSLLIPRGASPAAAFSFAAAWLPFPNSGNFFCEE